VAMTRRDYEVIAETLRISKPRRSQTDDIGQALRVSWNNTVENFAAELRGTNPWFDPARFRRACGYND